MNKKVDGKRIIKSETPRWNADEFKRKKMQPKKFKIQYICSNSRGHQEFIEPRNDTCSAS